ncbi:MAG TPA: hypothetical protein DCW90_18930 [Lachnospiraceae bacterium]|nr:hypothetical protein [Lachnospiraceae bacterium]
MLLFGSAGFMESQMNTAYATPSVVIRPLAEWHVWGRDLYHEIPLARTRFCPQGIGYVTALINRCIRENRVLRVICHFGIWTYSIK